MNVYIGTWVLLEVYIFTLTCVRLWEQFQQQAQIFFAVEFDGDLIYRQYLILADAYWSPLVPIRRPCRSFLSQINTTKPLGQTGERYLFPRRQRMRAICFANGMVFAVARTQHSVESLYMSTLTLTVFAPTRDFRPTQQPIHSMDTLLCYRVY